MKRRGSTGAEARRVESAGAPAHSNARPQARCFSAVAKRLGVRWFSTAFHSAREWVGFIIILTSVWPALAQQTPTSTASPISTPAESLSATPAPLESVPPPAAASPSVIPSPGGTAAAARSVRISFVPPPLEGTISLGIYDQSGALLRILHKEAKMDEFVIGEDALVTKWDGKNDRSEDLPSGKYRARGYLVGQIKVEPIANVTNPPPDFNTAASVSIKLMSNPLANDERPTISLAVGFDEENTFLRTTDGLPLVTVDRQAHLVRVAITKSGDKSVDIWKDDGASLTQLRIYKVDKMMAFDCGDLELK